jgi:NADH-quinone oxidoreductase subunit L
MLFVGSIVAGGVFYEFFVGDGAHDFWGHSIVHAKENYLLVEKYDKMYDIVHAAHYVPFWVKAAPFFAMLAGTALAFYMYILHPGLAARARNANPGVYDFLLNKWYFDELYQTIFVRPAMALGRLFWKKGDGKTIDGAINGLSMGLIPAVTSLYTRVQSGYVFHYALAMFIGVAALVTFAVAGG